MPAVYWKHEQAINIYETDEEFENSQGTHILVGLPGTHSHEPGGVGSQGKNRLIKTRRSEMSGKTEERINFGKDFKIAMTYNMYIIGRKHSWRQNLSFVAKF